MQLCVWERPWKGFSKGLQGSVALPALAPVQGNRFWPPDLPISRAECCSPWCLPPFFSVEHLLLCIQEHHREHMIGEIGGLPFPGSEGASTLSVGVGRVPNVGSQLTAGRPGSLESSPPSEAWEVE